MRFHILSVLSPLPLIARVPSANTAQQHTQTVCPSKVYRSVPFVRFHTLSVLSILPLIARVPSANTAQQFTCAV